MASQLRDSFTSYSKIFRRKSEHLNVSWDALVPWSISGYVFRVLLSLLGTTLLSSLILFYFVAYSDAFWVISPFLSRRLFEIAGGFRMKKKGLAVSFLAHNVYGVFLGLLMPVFV